MRKEQNEPANTHVDNHSMVAGSGAGHEKHDNLNPPARPKSKRRSQVLDDSPSRVAASGEIGHPRYDAPKATANLATLCNDLKNLQVRRRHLIRSKDRNRLALGSLVRRHLGWRADLSEKQRDEIRTKAAKLIDDALEGIVAGDEWLTEFALDCEAACAPFDKRLAVVEKEMVKIAEQLPAAAWVKTVRGFGIKTLGVIVGEAGDLSNYANPGKLWKRLGLAPKDEYAQSDEGKHMVPRQRRAQIWACLGDPLLKLNDGPYRAAYDAKKAEYMARAATEPFWQFKGKPHLNHCHRAAHRYMEKLAIKDLWLAWRAAMPGVKS